MSVRDRLPAAMLSIPLILPGLVSGCDTGEARRVPRSGDRPDIVLVSIDSLRHDHLGSYGYAKPTSPTLDRLASEGARFSNAIATTSWTLPSHAALFTGLFDSSHGVVRDGQRLADEHTTLAEALHVAGYQTAGFFGGPYLHPVFGLGQGFESYTSCMTRVDEALPEAEIRRQAQGGLDKAHADVTGPRTLDRVEDWLPTVGEQPFFLFLHMWDVHYDYIPPQRYVELFDPDYAGSLEATRFATNRAIHAGMPARDLEHLVALYDAEIRFTDDVVGQILDQLAARGLLENAIVVVTADHGEEFFEHGGRGHRRTLFDEVIRVPLIVSWPGAIEPAVIDDQVRLVDVMPTLLSLAGLEVPGPMQGRDLSPLLSGAPLEEAPALAELHAGRHALHALRTNRYKLISAPGARFVFYHLLADPGERRPLSAEGAGYAAARADLRAITREALALSEQLAGRAATAEVPPELERQLESLGYLDD